MTKKSLTQKEVEQKEKAQTAKFLQLATKRTNNTIQRIRQLSNLASPNYKYTSDQVENMFSAIVEELKVAKNKFDCKTTQEQTGFKFR